MILDEISLFFLAESDESLQTGHPWIICYSQRAQSSGLFMHPGVHPVRSSCSCVYSIQCRQVNHSGSIDVFDDGSGHAPQRNEMAIVSCAATWTCNASYRMAIESVRGSWKRKQSAKAM